MSAANPETVLVTGASSGIGLELARCFAADGSRLVLTARNTAALESLAAELRRDNKVEAIVLTADLSRPETPRQLFSELKGRGIDVDILVNNAGFGAHGLFSELPVELQLGILQVNVTAVTELTRLFLPGMLKRGHGGVLNVGSVAGFVPGPGMAVYYATKSFVLSFTEALAGELAGTGIKITVLCPGPTETNFGKVANFDFNKASAPLVRVASMSARDVAVDGHRAFRERQVITISGWRNRFLLMLAWLFPRWAIRAIARKFNGI